METIPQRFSRGSGYMKNNCMNDIKEVINTEQKAISKLIEQVDDAYEEALKVIIQCKGKVIVSGMGKSGLIGKKIAATLSSTGTPAFFVHPAESIHGDLGMIEKDDVVILISNSGETREVLNMLPSLKKIKCSIISITSNKNSTISKESHVPIVYNYDKEADHLNLAPTVSSTLTLVIGDAIAVAISKHKKFTKENFHLYHPGGTLGARIEGE